MGTLTLEVGGRRFDGGSSGSQWIGKDGLDGWWDSAEPTYEETSQQDKDGAFDPVEVLVGPRRVDVYLIIESSSPEWAELDVRRWAASLSKSTDLGFRVFHGDQWLSLRNAKIRGRVTVRPNRRRMRLTDVRFTVWAADPRKYGEIQSKRVDAVAPESGGMAFPIVNNTLDFSASGSPTFPGVFRINNPGTAEFYPVFKITGPLTSFTISSESQTVEYSGAVAAGQELVLSPYAGGRAVLDGADVSTNLTEADWVPVWGEQERGYQFIPTSPGAATSLTVEWPEGAWW